MFGWTYKTKVGTFLILPNEQEPGRWKLIFEGEWYGTYGSPELAADDVRSQATGADEWDLLEVGVDYPSDLGEWTRFSLPSRG